MLIGRRIPEPQLISKNTTADELIPHISEVLRFSKEYYGSILHLSIARNYRDDSIGCLTNLFMNKYDQIWSQFDSEFWRYKKTNFGVKRTEFCYADKWSLYIDLTTGEATSCYNGQSLGDVFVNPDVPLSEKPIGKCRSPIVTMGIC